MKNRDDTAADQSAMHLDRPWHAVYFWSIATSTFTEPDQRSTSRYIGKRVLKDRRSRGKRVCVCAGVCACHPVCFLGGEEAGRGSRNAGELRT